MNDQECKKASEAIENDCFLVRYNGKAWMFKELGNAELFMSTREGSTITPVYSGNYFMQFTDSIPNY